MRMFLFASLVAIGLTSIPAAVGDHSVESGRGRINSAWAINGRYIESCGEEFVLNAVQVNSRYLISVETPVSNAAGGVVSSIAGGSCDLITSIEPGVIRNPCQGVNGGVSVPMPTTNPYFYHEVDGRHHLRLTTPDGGIVDYYYDRYYVWDLVNPPYFEGMYGGTCRLGPIYGAWQGYYHQPATVPP